MKHIVGHNQKALELLHSFALITTQRQDAYVRRDAYNFCNQILTTLDNFNAPLECINYWKKVTRTVEKGLKPSAKLKQTESSGNIELDTSEKDCILIWQKQKDATNVIFIDRNNLKKIIQVLTEQLA